MIKINLGIITVICMFIIGCSGQYEKETSTGYLQKGQYEFTMYDSTGKKVSEGNLTVKQYSEKEISGNFSLTKVIEEFTGYQSMSKGEFTGKVNQKEKNVLINTNPGVADDNVFFNLKINSSSLEGEWYYTASRRVSTPGKITFYKKP
jgi:uncharacterized protein YaiE (UPF0345 family)